jgi:hypothetical protein
MNVAEQDPIEMMLKQKTGISFRDSGNAYGRNFEYNQERDFKSEPLLEVTPYLKDTEPEYFKNVGKYLYEVDEVLFTLNIYHYLHNFLWYSETARDLTGKLYAQDDEDKRLAEFMGDFASDFDDGTSEVVHYQVAYTYNAPDNILSQDILFVEFAYRNRNFMIVSTHQGCDARHGFSDPVVFEMKDIGFDIEDCSIPFREAMFYVDADEFPPEIDFSQSIFSMEELEKLTVREVRRWESDDGGYNFCSEDAEDLIKEVPLYYDDHEDKYYTGDWLLYLTFDPAPQLIF